MEHTVMMIHCYNDRREIIEGGILAQCKMIRIVKVTEVSNHVETVVLMSKEQK